MATNNINSMLAYAIKRAVSEFSPEIILERRFIAILKDYGAFRELLPSELITRIIIESGRMRMLDNLRKTQGKMVHDAILREITNLEREYGFSEKYSRPTLLSILTGLDISYDIQDIASARQTIASRTTKNKGITLTTRDDKVQNRAQRFRLLDIRQYPQGQEYLELGKELSRLNNGTLPTGHSLYGKNYTLFSCDYIPYRNVQVKISEDSMWTPHIQITLLKIPSKDSSIIRDEIYRINAILDWNYKEEKPITKLNENFFSDSLLNTHFRINRNEENEFILRCYNIKEGTVRSKLHLTDTGFYITVNFHFRLPRT